MEHRVAEQFPVKTLRVNLYQVRLKCTCGRNFFGKGRTEENAVRKAETVFREHIPIRG